jgi:hypothetical protein
MKMTKLFWGFFLLLLLTSCTTVTPDINEEPDITDDKIIIDDDPDDTSEPDDQEEPPINMNELEEAMYHMEQLQSYHIYIQYTLPNDQGTQHYHINIQNNKRYFEESTTYYIEEDQNLYELKQDGETVYAIKVVDFLTKPVHEIDIQYLITSVDGTEQKHADGYYPIEFSNDLMMNGKLYVEDGYISKIEYMIGDYESVFYFDDFNQVSLTLPTYTMLSLFDGAVKQLGYFGYSYESHPEGFVVSKASTDILYIEQENILMFSGNGDVVFDIDDQTFDYNGTIYSIDQYYNGLVSVPFYPSYLLGLLEILTLE